MDERKALEEVAASAARGDMVFPTHAEMALRVRRALDDPDSSVDKLAKLIQAEPLLADQLAPIGSPVSNLAGMSREGVGVKIDVALDDETLSEILEDAAEEVRSLTSALHS